MPTLSGNCSTRKPIIDVALAPIPPRAASVSADQEAPVFPLTPLRALLDTGADGTSISRRVARSHRLTSYGKRSVVGVGGVNTHATWAVYLGIFYDEDGEFEGEPNSTRGLFVVPDALMAIEIPDNKWFDCIIGRDVLTQFDFSMKRGGIWRLDLY